ncbi:MAG: hypothetical protein IT204_11245 [Fimbriimonadaceae bacterium]|nr:hypothetical protein [Fimbriimonadaceae bacterium]
MPSPYYVSQATLRQQTGVIVPTWFPADYDPAAAAAVLATTLADTELIAAPQHCLVVSDGSQVAADAAREVLPAACVVVLEAGPHGKGGAVAAGFERLLERPELHWLVVRDHDGDHFAGDLPRLQRLALQMAAEAGVERILVNGGRRDPARPMGWVRAEYERLVNAVVWRGLAYWAAWQGAAVDERWLEPGTAEPDLQSGYKLYNRAAAEALVRATAGSSFPLRRWGCEVLATVEVLRAGGAVGEINRLCLDEQPLTTYEGDASRVQIHGDILRWVARRLALPAGAVALWFDAALARRPLRTLPGLVEPLAALRRYVLEGLAAADLAAAPSRAPWIV